jgi:hypothetical protein
MPITSDNPDDLFAEAIALAAPPPWARPSATPSANDIRELAPQPQNVYPIAEWSGDRGSIVSPKYRDRDIEYILGRQQQAINVSQTIAAPQILPATITASSAATDALYSAEACIPNAGNISVDNEAPVNRFAPGQFFDSLSIGADCWLLLTCTGGYRLLAFEQLRNEPCDPP